MAEVKFRDKDKAQKEDHITHIYMLRVADATSENEAVRAANRWVENRHSGITSSAKTGTNIEKVGETGTISTKNIYHTTTKIDEFDEDETDTSKTDEEWLDESGRTRNSITGGERSYDKTPTRTSPREILRRVTDNISNNIKQALKTPAYYADRVFVKGKLSETGKIQIPSIEREATGIEALNRYNGAILSPIMEEPAFMWDARVTSNAELIVRQEFFEGHDVKRDALNWVQILLLNTPADPVAELDSMSKDYWFNNMIWKQKLRGKFDTHQRITIRQREWRALNYDTGESLTVVMFAIDEDNNTPVGGKMRFSPNNIIRINGTIQFRPPKRIVAMPAFSGDEIVQIIAQPGRFSQ